MLAPPFESIDPAALSDVGAFAATSVAYDGLIGFERVGGGSGARLVPDLATSIPIPTDGGRTYTFQVRRGIHYSTGEPVQPADLRRSIERLLANQLRLRLRAHRRCRCVHETEAEGSAEALRPLPGNRRRCGLEHDHLPSDGARPGLPGQARGLVRVRRAVRDAVVRASPAPTRHRPVHDRELRPEARGPARSQPPVSRVVAGGPTGRLPRRDRPPVRRRSARPGRSHEAERGRLPEPLPARRRPVPAERRLRKQAARRSRAEHVLPLPEHETGPVRQRRREAGTELRGRPGQAGRAQRRPRCRAVELSGAGAQLRRLRTLLPLRPRPGQGEATGRRVRHDGAGGHGVDAGDSQDDRRLPRLRPAEPRLQGKAQGDRREGPGYYFGAPWRPRKAPSRPASAAGSPHTRRAPPTSPSCSPAPPTNPAKPTTSTTAGFATRASTATSPTRSSCRPATRTRRACSGARSTARSSTRHRGSRWRTASRPTSSLTGSATTSTTRCRAC